MIQNIFAPVRGILSYVFYFVSALITVSLIYLTALLRFITPHKRLRHHCTRFLYNIPHFWADKNYAIMRLIAGTKLSITGLDALPKHEWYLLIANHQNWADILVLYSAFRHLIPSPKFFMKKELIKVPLIGLACKLVDMPFMQRHTKETLRKHPELRGKDVETTRKACEKFKKIPITLINFVEGTRFTDEKYRRQKSPYQNLLKPKAGGIAFSLQAMGDIMHRFLDVTIYYEGAPPTFWNFACGRIKQVHMQVESFAIPEHLIGDYQNDPVFRRHFQAWLNERWQIKDKALSILKEPNQHA